MPLVFLNACHAGRVGAGLTYLGGWAHAFFDAGASAFIGSLWEINDALASQFARAFYDRLWGLGAFEGKPQPLGQAFSEARMAIRDTDPANPTWLAYVLYGDPYGEVILGDKAPA
jgi:CHAT domain-containing protein